MERYLCYTSYDSQGNKFYPSISHGLPKLHLLHSKFSDKKIPHQYIVLIGKN